jgi:hypothetical protein
VDRSSLNVSFPSVFLQTHDKLYTVQCKVYTEETEAGVLKKLI